MSVVERCSHPEPEFQPVFLEESYYPDHFVCAACGMKNPQAENPELMGP